MRRLIIVDDNLDILEVLQIAFESKGYVVRGVSNGEAAPAEIELFHPDIILLDVLLGSTNGITICNELKSNPRTGHIPIVMYSANLNREKILKACAADAFVGKPFNISHLARVIGEQLEG